MNKPRYRAWYGNIQYVPAITSEIEIIFRNGLVARGKKFEYRWEHIGNPFDIIAYRRLQ